MPADVAVVEDAGRAGEAERDQQDEDAGQQRLRQRVASPDRLTPRHCSSLAQRQSGRPVKIPLSRICTRGEHALRLDQPPLRLRVRLMGVACSIGSQSGRSCARTRSSTRCGRSVLPARLRCFATACTAILVNRDFAVFTIAGKLAVAGHAADAYTVAGNRARCPGDGAGGGFAFPLSAARPVMAVPISFLPFSVAFWGFQAATAALFYFAARSHLPANFPWLLAVLTPAALINIGFGQVGLLFGALWLWAFTGSAPAIALLTLKPHLGLPRRDRSAAPAPVRGGERDRACDDRAERGRVRHRPVASLAERGAGVSRARSGRRGLWRVGSTR